MASTLYVDFQQPAINSAWLNDVNRTQYTLLGNPNSTNDIRVALGLNAMALQSAGAVAITGGTISGVTFTGNIIGNATTATTAGNVTGTVAVANGGTGDTGTVWTTAATGAITPLVGSGLVASGTMRYKIIGKTVFIQLAITITTLGTTSGNFVIAGAFPVAPYQTAVIGGRENNVTGSVCFGSVAPGGVNMFAGRYDNTLTGFTNGSLILLNGSYESV